MGLRIQDMLENMHKASREKNMNMVSQGEYRIDKGHL